MEVVMEKKKGKRRGQAKEPRVKSITELYELYKQGVDIMLTLPEISRILSLHPSSLRYWILQGELDAYRFGRIWRIKLSDLIKWLEEKKFAEGKND